MEGFKPYKGVSSNISYNCCFIQLTVVSNPIREYLQIHQVGLYRLLVALVSNPIREYLQMYLQIQEYAHQPVSNPIREYLQM